MPESVWGRRRVRAAPTRPLMLPDLQPLLGRFKGEDLIIGCHVDLTATRGILLKWPVPFPEERSRELSGNES